MSAAVNAAAFLSMRGKLRAAPIDAQRHAAPPPIAQPAPCTPRAEARGEPRRVRVTYRRGRLAGSS